MPHPHASQDAKKQTGPAHVRCLEIFLNNKCNLTCLNCCTAIAKKADEVRELSWEDVKGAIDVFMDAKQTPYPGRKTVILAGGEPFLSYKLVVKAADYLQKFRQVPQVEVYTSGTFLTKENAAELRSLGVTIVLSLDGAREDNDRYRRFTEESKRSVWDEVMKRVEGLPMEGFATNTILRPDSLEGTLKALEHFHKLGIRRMDLWVDYLHVWSPEDLHKLEKFMAALGDLYAGKLEKSGKLPWDIPMLSHALLNGTMLARKQTWWRPCVRLILGADGQFYDCEGAFLLPYHQLGDQSAVKRPAEGRGVDWAAREAFMAEADKALKAMGAESDWQYVCPRVYYKALTLMKADPRPMVENLHRVSKVFLGGFVRLAARLKDNEAFRRKYLSEEFSFLS